MASKSLVRVAGVTLFDSRFSFSIVPLLSAKMRSRYNKYFSLTISVAEPPLFWAVPAPAPDVRAKKAAPTPDKKRAAPAPDTKIFNFGSENAIISLKKSFLDHFSRPTDCDLSYPQQLFCDLCETNFIARSFYRKTAFIPDLH